MKIISLVILTLVLSACSNVITYQHSERNSISLEAKMTDPQQPLQGTIGIKTRTILATPKIADGESASVISDFKLERKKGGAFGETSIQSAFITGDAAIAAPPASAAAISGLGFGEIGDLSTHRVEMLKSIYRSIKAIASAKGQSAEKIASAKKHLARLDKLAKLLPDMSKIVFYSASATALTVKPSITVMANFQGVLDYEGALRANVAHLNQAISTRAMAIPTGDSLQKRMAQVKKDKAEFFALIGNSNIIDSATAFAVSNL